MTDLQLGSDGAVWAATEGGLSRVEDGRVMTLTSKNGLPCDAVSWVMEDNDHSFWLYMPCGLVRIARSELDGWVSDSKRSVQTTVFDSSDGVRSRGRYWLQQQTIGDQVARWENMVLTPGRRRALSIRGNFPSTGCHRRCTSSKSLLTARPTMPRTACALPAARSRSQDRLHGAKPCGAGESSFPLQAGRTGLRTGAKS